MRVLCFVLLVIAQPVWASEAPVPKALADRAVAREAPIRIAFARFAYADTSAFHNSIRQRVSERSTNFEKRLPHLPRDVIGNNRLVDQPPKTPLPLLKSVEADLPQPAHLATSRVEPEAVPAVPTIKPLIPQPPQTEQKLAALPEPMHLLPKTPSAEISATEVDPVVHKPKTSETSERRKPRARPVKQTRPYRKPAPKPKQAETPAKIPRWAEQMFNSTWQNRAFAYQR